MVKLIVAFHNFANVSKNGITKQASQSCH